MRLLVTVVMAVAVGAGIAAQDAGGVYKKGDEGLTMPTITRKARPSYTDAAMRARIQGTVKVEAVVLKNGSVDGVTVTRSLDQTYGLDDQAIKAARRLLFKPGTKDDRPVPVRVEIEFTFTLR